MPDQTSMSASSLRALTAELRANGLDVLGFFHVEDHERLLPDRDRQPKAVLIVGNVGSRLWPIFEAARNDRPSLTLDQWTAETVGRIAAAFAVDAVFPFEGPPYHPFLRWAKRTGTLFASPLGLTIHPTYGLWHAFRAALLLDHRPDLAREKVISPCDSCATKPCLSACPVNAFTAEGYAFETCLDHLVTPVNDCRQRGCLARLACPIGTEHHYVRDHAAFHMGQLLKAHGKA